MTDTYTKQGYKDVLKIPFQPYKSYQYNNCRHQAYESRVFLGRRQIHPETDGSGKYNPRALSQRPGSDLKIPARLVMHQQPVPKSYQ
ncbi:hypothetical protein WJX72_012413 [[Myrmecia] bisecta]